MAIIPVKPRGWSDPAKAIVAAELDRLGRLVTTTAASYPPWRPWKSRPPRTGPRAGGRRTGALGKSISYRVSTGPGSITLQVGSRGVRYATYVKGRRQTRVMAERAWRKFLDDFGQHYPGAQRRLAAWTYLRRSS